jgi:hypothetical protein
MNGTSFKPRTAYFGQDTVNDNSSTPLELFIPGYRIASLRGGMDLGSRLMANLMLPDGAEKHLEDWTIFFLNQTPFNTIEPVLALDGHEDEQEPEPELLYVLNLVRTKQDKSLPR